VIPLRATPWILPGVAVLTFLVLTLLEGRRPLRRQREPRQRRLFRNLTVAGLGLAVIQILQIPLLVPVSRWTTDNAIGALNFVGLSGPARFVAAVLLLDYTLWIWHWLNHRAPFLWRFHSVHHVDRDMDASTGIRFHFGELGLSVGFRAPQIVAIGADPAAVWTWQILLFCSILFHHSNTRLPIGLERLLVRVIVTPRMHGIHHSDFENEANSNWSSLLSVWDYLHGTALLGIPQQTIEIGVAAYQDLRRVTLGRILVLPFVPHRDDWRREDGRPPVRMSPAPPPSVLSE
jgi:sterol desaturase/sphingolipid hydroxylase (fatty acid hydroxylase superfamily)